MQRCWFDMDELSACFWWTIAKTKMKPSQPIYMNWVRMASAHSTIAGYFDHEPAPIRSLVGEAFSKLRTSAEQGRVKCWTCKANHQTKTIIFDATCIVVWLRVSHCRYWLKWRCVTRQCSCALMLLFGGFCLYVLSKLLSKIEWIEYTARTHNILKYLRDTWALFVIGWSNLISGKLLDANK